MTHLVVGAGEVGTAVAAVLTRAHHTIVRDLEPVDVVAEVMHVCIPYSDQLTKQVQAYQRRHGAELVVVHSTVPVGTCDPQGWVHSPVRGRHPDLEPALDAFTKHFGGAEAALAAKLWHLCGGPVEVHDRAVETEAGKLFELVQLGAQVRIQHAIYDWCVERGIDPDAVYRRFAETYNAGYSALGEQQFVRPVLEYQPGPIGGHCVRPCSALLDHPLAQWVAQ